MGGRDEIYSYTLLVLTFGCCVVFAFDIMPRARSIMQEKKRRRNREAMKEAMAALAHKATEFLVFGGLYFIITIALIYVNAWIIDSVFPYAATLTLCQMLFCSAMSGFCILGLKLTQIPDFVTFDFWVKKFLVLGLLYAVYLWGSNLAYKYLEVGFVQIIKPLGGFLIYATLVYRGFERLTVWKAINMTAIFVAISIASCGQQEIGSFSWLGLTILILSLCANAFYFTLLQYMLQPEDETQLSSKSSQSSTEKKNGITETSSTTESLHKSSSPPKNFKLNPLTTMFLVGPASAFWLIIMAATTEWATSSFAWTIPAWLLFVDCALAFALNIAIMYLLKVFSALTYALCGYAKDVIVVGLSIIIVSEKVSSLEWQAYSVMLFGQAIWLYRKIDEQIFVEQQKRVREKEQQKCHTIEDYYGTSTMKADSFAQKDTVSIEAFGGGGAEETKDSSTSTLVDDDATEAESAALLPPSFRV